MLDEIHLPLKDDAYEIHVDSIACYLASLHFKSSYLGSLWDLFPWLTLLEHGLSFFGPLDGPTHSQHALQRLLHGIAVGLPLLNRFQPMERSYHIIISVNNCPALDIFFRNMGTFSLSALYCFRRGWVLAWSSTFSPAVQPSANCQRTEGQIICVIHCVVIRVNLHSVIWKSQNVEQHSVRHLPSQKTISHGNAQHICWQCNPVFQAVKCWK